MFQEKARVLQFTQVIFYVCDVLATRIPVKVSGLTNVLLPFPTNIWIAIAISVLAMSLAFFLIHKVYDCDRMSGLINPVRNKLDFPLYTFACLTEPLELTWFKGFSGGEDSFA